MTFPKVVLPLLPGLSLERRKENYHRPQIWSSRGGVRLEVQEGDTHDKVKMVSVPRADGQGCENRPAWEAFDRFVLRFYGRFNDASRLQHYGTAERLVKILFFMEDNTMSITEINDGEYETPTGLVRRHRIPNLDNGYFSPQDLRVGEIIEVYSRRFCITGCDEFTREFYKKSNDPQPENTVPVEKKQKEIKDSRLPRTEEKMFTEVMLGGGHYNNNMEKFMLNDRKVCRFYAVMDDLNTTQYERKPFVVFYYLADDTVMIYEQFPPNCGRDSFPVFYRRARMPRSGHTVTAEITFSSDLSDASIEKAKTAVRSVAQAITSSPITCTFVKMAGDVTPRNGSSYVFRMTGLPKEARSAILSTTEGRDFQTRLARAFKTRGVQLRNGCFFTEDDIINVTATGSGGGDRQQGLIGGPCREDEYIGLHDFEVGIRIEMMKNEFFIYDADNFTREHYEKNLGITLGDKIDVSLPQKPVPVAPTPEYPGYGSKEDSMGSVHRLIPQPPRKDMSNFYNNVDKVLRFRARMCDKRAGGDRDFVINYHLQDGTFAMHIPHKNGAGGELTGKYLEKGHHVNELTNANIDLVDLIPRDAPKGMTFASTASGSTPRSSTTPRRTPRMGATLLESGEAEADAVYDQTRTIRLYSRDFEVYAMDAYTRKYIGRMDEKRAAEPPPCDLNVVLGKIRRNMSMQQKLCQDIFRRFDRNRDGVLTEEEFTFALRKFGFELSTVEIHKLMRYFDPTECGQIAYTEFCDAIYDPDYIDREPKRTVNMEDTTLYSARASSRRDSRKEDTEIRRAVRLMGEVLHNRPALVKRLRFELDNIAGKEKMIDVGMLQLGFQRCGYVFSREDVERCLIYVCKETRVHYVNFLLKFQASFHDFYAMR